jgi:transcriptional regulator with XRE-family HTH domain
MNNDIDDVDLSIPIGTVVRAWREARGLTVTQLAERAGRPVTKGYLSELEHNKTLHPGNAHLTKLAGALEIPVRYLINRNFPDEAAKVEQSHLATQSDFTFGAPNLSERRSESRIAVLKDILREIAEMNRRSEELRRVVEELLRTEKRVR